VYLISPVENEISPVALPPSKSITHRAFILAALNKGTSYIDAPLLSEDTEITIEALKAMGAEFNHTDSGFSVKGSIGNVRQNEIYLGNSGSSARFLLPLAPMLDRPVKFNGNDDLRKRPFSELIGAMREKGIRIDSTDNSLPAIVYPGSYSNLDFSFSNLPSSQILSGFLFASILEKKSIAIKHIGKIPSLPYFSMTMGMIQDLGLDIRTDGDTIYLEKPGISKNLNINIEKDYSAASYWVVLALITGKKVILKDASLPSLQGDCLIFSVAEQAGGKVSLFHDRIEVEGGITSGFSGDYSDTPDLVPSLAILALFAPKPVTFANVSRLQFKETDRIHAIRTNIEALGGKTSYNGSDLIIYPIGKSCGAIINSFNDHRIAMSFAVAGTRISGTTIDNPSCVSKSYPEFWKQFIYFKEIRN